MRLNVKLFGLKSMQQKTLKNVECFFLCYVVPNILSPLN